MKGRIVSLALSSIFVAAAAVAAAQDATPPPPPNVLVIQREYLKPGKAGAIHANSENNFVRAETAAKWPTHYIAMDSMSGPTRALFVFAYDSFADYGKDQEAQNANPTLSAALDSASLTDGELLNRYDSSAWVYHPEMSVHASVDVPHQRYWEFTVFRIKEGHYAEWMQLVKIYTDGFAKYPDAHWATFENQYGENGGGEWLVITPMRNLGEVDKGLSNGKDFFASLADSGKQVGELAGASIDSVQTNLFVVNPKESYVDASWATTAPEIYGH